MLYPMTFKPILKKIIWGGSDICPFKGITPVEEGIGESWELSHVEGNYSIVNNGDLEGKSLDELIRTYGKQLLGEKVMDQLDVYKRQYPFRRGFSIGGACSSPRLRHDQRSRPRAGLERKEQTETGRSRNCRTPVSYTHLDVYKRQARRWVNPIFNSL